MKRIELVGGPDCGEVYIVEHLPPVWVMEPDNGHDDEASVPEDGDTYWRSENLTKKGDVIYYHEWCLALRELN